MKDIKISIIVPVYNTEKYIVKCIQSLVNQTLQEIEIIIVNDGSTDNSLLMIEDLIKKNSKKIKVVSKANGGLSDARNYGMKYALGEYITFLDSDDYVENNLYEELYSASNNGSKRIVECNFWYEYPTKQVVDLKKEYTDIKDYLLNGRVVAWNKIYKRDWISSLGVQFPYGLYYEDIGFFFSIVPNLNSIDDVALVTQPLIHYVQRGGSISNTHGEKVIDAIRSYQYGIYYLAKNKLFNEYKEEIEFRCVKQMLLTFPVRKIIKIKDKGVRKHILSQLWDEIEVVFPNWKKNKYLQLLNIKCIYLKLIKKTVFINM